MNSELQKEVCILREQIDEIINNLKKQNMDTTNETSSDLQQANSSATQHRPRSDNRHLTAPVVSIVASSQLATFRLLNETLKIKNFKIKRLDKNKHYVQLETLSEFDEFTELLKSRQFLFHTYTPKINKPQSIGLEGLDTIPAKLNQK